MVRNQDQKKKIVLDQMVVQQTLNTYQTDQDLGNTLGSQKTKA